MAYLQTGKDNRIESATVEDIRARLDAGGIITMELGHNNNQTLQGTIIGGSASILFIDKKKARAQLPQGRLDRAQAKAVFEHFLESEELHPDYTWVDANLPTVSTGRGCRKSAAALLLLLVLASGAIWAFVIH